MNVVLDTNILVSAAWSPGKTASDILVAALSGQFNIFYDLRIIEEYFRVMYYPNSDSKTGKSMPFWNQ